MDSGLPAAKVLCVLSDPEEGDRLRRALGGFTLVGPEGLQEADLLILDLPSLMAHGPALEGKRKPLLLVLSPEEIEALDGFNPPTPLWDIIARPVRKGEFLLRVRNLLGLGKCLLEMTRQEVILENSPTVLFYLEATHDDFVPRWVSPNMGKVFGVVEGFDRLWRESVHPDDLPKILRKKELLRSKDLITLTYRVKKGEDGYIWIEEKVRPLRDREGKVLGMVGSWTDVTERVELEGKLRETQRELLRLATHDFLTDLPNRRLFFDRLELALARAKRFGHRVVVVFMDVDDLKPINDRYGHQAGDRVLQELASRLRASLREMDTVARLGGDEFGLILTDIPKECTLMSFWERLEKALKEPIPLQGESLRVGVSYGSASYPEDGQTSEELLRVADSRMYAMKRAKSPELPR